MYLSLFVRKYRQTSLKPCTDLCRQLRSSLCPELNCSYRGEANINLNFGLNLNLNLNLDLNLLAHCSFDQQPRGSKLR